MDPNRHHDPDRFEPNRYINDTSTCAESGVLQDVTQRDNFVFGAGRRFCLGTHIAERTLFLAMARLMWAFTFRRPKDAAGNELIPDRHDWIEGIVSVPAPFPMEVVSRGEARAERVRKEWKVAKETFLDGEGQWSELPEGVGARRKDGA